MNAKELFDNANGPIMNARLFVAAASEAGFDLFLTGSHFFGNAVPESDWDFFTKNDPGVCDWLREKRFTSHRTDDYPDKQTVAVFKGTIPLCHVHVQIVKDVAIKMLAQYALKRAGTLKFLDDYGPKVSPNKQILRSSVWNLAITAVQERQIQNG